jgi:hypothetical protein
MTFDLPEGSFALLHAALEGRPQPQAVALHDAGLLLGGAPHPDLATALAPITAGDWELRMEIGDAVGRGWLGGGRLVLHTPGERLALLGADQFAGTVAALVGLGPRPHEQDAETTRMGAGELALALASDQGHALPLLRTLRLRWRVDARRPGEQRVVEALDTDHGIWLIVPDGSEVELLPVTPTRVFRLLVALTDGPRGASA